MDTTSITAEQWITSTQAIAALVGLLSAGVIAAISSYLTYKFTRKTRLEAEWRIDKLAKYEQLLSALSKASLSDSDDDTQAAILGFMDIANTISLVAPRRVLDGLSVWIEAVLELSRERAPHTTKAFKEALRMLVFEIRRDLHIEPMDDVATFGFVFVAEEFWRIEAQSHKGNHTKH